MSSGKSLGLVQVLPSLFLSALKGEDMATTDQRTVVALEHIYKELEKQNKILIYINNSLAKLVKKETNKEAQNA